MKKLLPLLLVISACGKDDVVVTEGSILGIWEVTYHRVNAHDGNGWHRIDNIYGSMRYGFDTDGTFSRYVVEDGYEDQVGSWRLEDGKLVLKYESDTYGYDVTLNDNTLKLERIDESSSEIIELKKL